MSKQLPLEECVRRARKFKRDHNIEEVYSWGYGLGGWEFQMYSGGNSVIGRERLRKTMPAVYRGVEELIRREQEALIILLSHEVSSSK